jgi:hypothetical protein
MIRLDNNDSVVDVRSCAIQGAWEMAMPISGAAANNIAQCFLHLSSFHSTQNQILSPMMNDLLSLPQELHIQILSHLDAISLTQCAMVGICFFRLKGTD